MLTTGAAEACILKESPLLCIIYTYDCIPTPPTVQSFKFADDTIVVGLVSAANETDDRSEIKRLNAWRAGKKSCFLNTLTNELVNFRKNVTVEDSTTAPVLLV